MDVEQLKALVTVAEADSVTRAAELLRLAQSADTRQIWALEESSADFFHVDTVLFHRLYVLKRYRIVHQPSQRLPNLAAYRPAQRHHYLASRPARIDQVLLGRHGGDGLVLVADDRSG